MSNNQNKNNIETQKANSINTNIICELPWRCVNINGHGNVYPCCDVFCNYYSFGNILTQPFDEIWNGKRAQNFRKQFLTNNFKYCNLKTCLPFKSNDIINDSEIEEQRPKSVLLAYDRTCNINCIFCKPDNYKSIEQRIDKFERTDKWIIDLFRDVECVNISCAGEALFSKHSRTLIKKIVNFYPNIKFDILTNGLLFDEENLSELNIIDKLSNVGISFHTYNKNTYNKIIKGSNFDRIMKNIEFASKLKKENRIKALDFRSVINVYTYKEMINFAKKTKEYNANAHFLLCIQFDLDNRLYNFLQVTNKTHPEYNSFLKILKHPIFKEDFIRINQSLFDLKPISIYESLKNKFLKNI